MLLAQRQPYRLRAQVMLLPEAKIGVCVFSNLRPSWFTEAVAKTGLDHALGVPAEDWVKFHTSAMALADFQTTLDRQKRAATRKPKTRPSLPPARYAGTMTSPPTVREVAEDDNGD